MHTGYLACQYWGISYLVHWSLVTLGDLLHCFKAKNSVCLAERDRQNQYRTPGPQIIRHRTTLMQDENNRGYIWKEVCGNPSPLSSTCYSLTVALKPRQLCLYRPFPHSPPLLFFLPPPFPFKIIYDCINPTDILSSI